MYRKITATLFLAIALSAAACGSDAETLTKAEFIKQADAICTKGNKAYAADFKAYTKKKQLKASDKLGKTGEEELVSSVLLPSLQEQVDELQDLGAPGEGDTLTDEFEGAVEQAEESPSSILTSSGGPLAEVAPKAEKYGFKVCFRYY